MKSDARTTNQKAIFDAILTGKYQSVKDIATVARVSSAYVSKTIKENPNVYKEYGFFRYKSIVERTLEIILEENKAIVDCNFKNDFGITTTIMISFSKHGIEETICKYIIDIFEPKYSALIPGYQSVLIFCKQDDEYKKISNYLLQIMKDINDR